MRQLLDNLRRYSAQLFALVLLAVLYALAYLPQTTEAERARLAGDFRFRQIALPEVPGRPHKATRAVNPSLQRLSGWISAVGASVALNDLDGNGLPDDFCHVDPRTDDVTVAPVPGPPARYDAFTLEAGPRLPFDRKTMAPMGCLPGDMNEDGLTDVLVYYWGRAPVAFLRQKSGAPATLPLSGDSYVPVEVAPGAGRWFTNAATFADLDGDGHLDLVIGNYFQDGARILDADADSREQMQHSMSQAFNGGRDRLLLWAGDASAASPSVSFKEAAGVLSDEVACGWTLAVGAADLDGDLLPELYLANDFGPDRLLHNLSKPGALRFELLEGRRTLTTPKSKVLGRDSFKGMGVDFGDLNGDGYPDIYVSNIADEYALEESHFAFLSTGRLAQMARGVAPYVDAGESLGLSRSGWGWDTKLDDFNNDGALEALQATGFMRGEINRWPELHELAMGNDQLLQLPASWPRFQTGDDLSGHGHMSFFVRGRDGRFHDIAKDLGLDLDHVGRGIATADVDGDGRLDFAVANQWDTSYFFHNEDPRAGAFLELRLRLPVTSERGGGVRVFPGTQAGDVSGRPAVGGAATVYLPGERRLVAQVDGGNGHSGRRSPDLHFGLGALPPDQRVRVDLHWRDAGGVARQQTVNLSPGLYTVLLD
jgi:hypothetical protein